MLVRAHVLLLALPSAAASCAGWCLRDALGQSHCGNIECDGCDACTNTVACTPSKKEDLNHEACSNWCKIEHKGAHCSACACKACSFCKAPSDTLAAVNLKIDASSASTTGAATDTAATIAAPTRTTPAPPPPPSSPDARLLAVDALSKLASTLKGKNVAWDDAFKIFDRKHNGHISSNEVQRVFHNHGLPPLPMHGVPATAVSLHGVDYGALHAMVPTEKPASPPPPPTPTSAAVIFGLTALATKLEEQQIAWDDAFKPYDRAASGNDGLVGANDLQAVFSKYGLPPPAVHDLPPKVTTLHGIDYRALHRLINVDVA